MMESRVLFLVLAYGVGSIPFGILFSKLIRGIDPREHGSRNIGFSNVLRSAGWFPGILTLIGDMGKGFLIVLVARELFKSEDLMLWAGVTVVLGHNFSLFLRLKGGKGVATGFGALLGSDPRIGLILIAIWGLVVAVFRYSSLGAIISYLMLPFVVWWYDLRFEYLVFSVSLGFIIILGHHSNISRLRRGVEPKLGGS